MIASRLAHARSGCQLQQDQSTSQCAIASSYIPTNLRLDLNFISISYHFGEQNTTPHRNKYLFTCGLGDIRIPLNMVSCSGWMQIILRMNYIESHETHSYFLLDKKSESNSIPVQKRRFCFFLHIFHTRKVNNLQDNT